MRFFIYMIALLSSCVVLSCVEEPWEDSQQSDLISVKFDFRLSDVVRSSINPDECKISNFNVFVYDRGLLVDNYYSTCDGAASMSLNAGTKFNVYVIANVGYVEPFRKEAELRNRCKLSISCPADIQDSLPLCGFLNDIIVNKTDQRFCVVLERLVSKILFSVDKTALKGLEVCSVRLCQSSVVVSPFVPGGSAASSSSDVADGDYCTDLDLELLNSGGSVAFYALENCQGVLLSGNGDPWKKIPSELDERAELCTYMEVKCRFNGMGLCDGEVIYRLYLGQDNCQDFNLLRNTVLGVSLCLTFDGLKDSVTWRVDADYSLNEGHASGWVSRGKHSERDLYVGEKFEYSIWVSEEMYSYVGSDMNDCEVCFRPFAGGEKDSIKFSEIKESDNGGYYVDATCVKPSEGCIFLKERDGDFLVPLSNYVFVGKPSVVISDKLYGSNQKIESQYVQTTCNVNGADVIHYVYFLDSEGSNLNVSSGCGYDLSVFDFTLSVCDGVNENVIGSFDVKTRLGVSGDGGPVLSLIYSCSNDGHSHPANLALLNMCNHHTSFAWDLTEDVCDIEETLLVIPESLPVELTLVDNAWAGYSDSRYAVIVDNPSNLPVNVDYWQFVTVDGDCDQTLVGDFVHRVENELIINPMEYVVSRFPGEALPVYGSSCSLLSERNSFGDVAIEDNGLLVYNLKGVDTDNLIAALTYDGWGYESMSHHISVTYSDGIPVRSLTVNDCLSDGSAAFSDKYGVNRLNDKGVWIYEGDSLVLCPDRTFEIYPGLNFHNITAMKMQTPVVGSMSYDKYGGNLFINAHSLGAEGLVLDSKTKARSDGYVRTYPNGTWGKEVDNYCVEELMLIYKGFPVLYAADSVIADGGAVSQLFGRIYANTYFDSWNKVGSSNSYMHSAHPTSLVINMSFRLSDQSDDAAYLFKPSFPIYVVFRHEQDGAEYTVPVNFSYNTFKFIEVVKK